MTKSTSTGSMRPLTCSTSRRGRCVSGAADATRPVRGTRPASTSRAPTSLRMTTPRKGTLDPRGFANAARLAIVAGKGGVGKTTVTATLARMASRAGLSTLIVEVEGKSGLPILFGAEDLDYNEVVMSPADRGAGTGEIRARTLTPDDALLEYLEDHGMKRISKRLAGSGALDVVATAAPGIKDILILGKVKQLERSGAADLIILDAPAAGHAITFLMSARGLLDAVRVGARRGPGRGRPSPRRARRGGGPPPHAGDRTAAARLIRERGIVICCGSGGVGKTTTAAVLALEGARAGRRACVVTIDPAKRLADALGLDRLSNTPSQIEGDWPGELWALMLDTKSTFDSLVAKYACDEDQAAGILANR